ncbi:sulfotransferase family 2 domain-containing protein [Persicobacter sp. CCB-QB2]|uniref:sulfotransferase family 2 domain-containing protein n=1 Tax=Persicobacter sp. CCB-QB2 TaxID=1561025 RepID=UPI0009E46B06|nr:sulfotransferase family 2 domain-containing protein [Persicobacter sp. CCB-QB2]
MTLIKQSLKNIWDVRFFLYKQPHRLLFEHVPKCGGTSVVTYLRQQYPGFQTFSMDNRAPLESVELFRKLSEEKRFQYRFLYGHQAHLIKDFVHPATKKFTILRDPIDRMVSHYYYVLRRPTHYLHQAVIEQQLDLKDYITLEISKELRNNYVHRFTQLEEGQMLELGDAAVDMAFQVLTQEYAYVGLLEQLEQDLAVAKKHFNFISAFKPVLANATAGRIKVEELDTVTLERVQELNRLDILLYQRIKTYRQRSFQY